MNFFLTLRLHSSVQAKQKDKQTISQLEKRLKTEQEARALAEKQLADERKRKKMEEASAARAVALAAATRYAFDIYYLIFQTADNKTKNFSDRLSLKYNNTRVYCHLLNRVESTDSLRGRIRELETEYKKLGIDMKLKEEQIRDLEGKCQVVHLTFLLCYGCNLKRQTLFGCL